LESGGDEKKPLGLASHNISTSNGSNGSYFIDKFDNDDDYSSFESDDDNSRDGDLENKSQAAGVHCSKLPDPPSASTGQVYAFVQRIKNFGSISKNEISKGISKIAKKRSSLAKMPTSKFYETCEILEDNSTTPVNANSETYIPPLKYDNKSIGKKSRGLSKLSKLGRLTINKLPTNFNLNDSEGDHYQTPKMGKGNNENNSSLNLSENDIEFRNQKNNKSSFTSKFRKSSAPSLSSSSTSNIYGSLTSKNSTFYVTDSLDVDSGIFAVNEKSTSSPDNSNLNLNSSSNSNNNISCDPKRRSIASISTSRPKDSPPPPPPSSEKARRSGSSSWYAECGLFKSGSGSSVGQGSDEKGEKIITSWYQESGLYQTSNNSVAR
jgi:neuronal guanine nucleotide exchange factor